MSVLSKIERKVGHSQDEQKTSTLLASLDEIRSGINNLVAMEQEDSSASERIKLLENLLLKLYDAITHSHENKESEQEYSLAKSNEAIALALSRIGNKESSNDVILEAIAENRRYNEEMIGMVENSIVNALSASEGRQIVFHEAAQVGQWRFHVVRDEHGDMSDVIATSTIR